MFLFLTSTFGRQRWDAWYDGLCLVGTAALDQITFCFMDDVLKPVVKGQRTLQLLARKLNDT